MPMPSLCSAAFFTLGMLAVACTTVDPSECWVNTSGGFGGSGPIPIGAGVGVSSGDFVSPRRLPLGTGTPPNPCVTNGGEMTTPGGPAGPPPGGTTGTGAGATSSDSFAGIDPQMLNVETLRASALAYYLDGAASRVGVDASDPVAMTAFWEQVTPEAEMKVDSWLATLGPSTIPTAGVEPKDECAFEFGCPRRATCVNPGSWSQDIPHLCYVVNCGVPKCSICPGFFPPELKTLAFKAWCSYLCILQGVQPPPIVAQGAVGIVARTGKPFPANGLAWCFNP
jgi:hypothetical protein